MISNLLSAERTTVWVSLQIVFSRPIRSNVEECDLRCCKMSKMCGLQRGTQLVFLFKLSNTL